MTEIRIRPVQPGQLTPHFHLREFTCQDPGAEKALTGKIRANLLELAQALEKVRSLCGNRPIRINSGFRTAEHNRKVGGKPKSQHLVGKAADIVVDGMSPSQVQSLLKDWPGGLGSYASWTHLDTGAKRRWVGP